MKSPIKSLPLLLLVLMAFRVTGSETNSPGRVLSDTLIGLASSTSPVGFALHTARGHQFIAYFDADRRITVAGRALDSTNWSSFQPDGIFFTNRGRLSNVTDWDAHNYLTLALDRDGYLHLSGNLHVDPLIYYRSKRPFDVTTFERLDRMTGESESKTTYPVFFKNAKGDLIFRYRDGGSGDGSDIYNIYNPDTRTWRHLNASPIIDGEGLRNAYASAPRLGPDGFFHMVWVWRETPDCSSNLRLSYARTKDIIHWETSRGAKLALPITFKTGEVIDPAKVKEGLINCSFNFGFDDRKQPVVVYHRYDQNGNSQIYAARPSKKSGWDIVQISDWNFRWDFSGGGTIPEFILLESPVLQPDGTFMVGYSMPFGPGSGRLQFDARTLRRLASLPPTAGPLPEELSQPLSKYPDMHVRTAGSTDQGRKWILRWESLPANRDLPRTEFPPPVELRLYEVANSKP